MALALFNKLYDCWLFFCPQVFAIIRSTDNPQMFAVEFIRGAVKKFMSTDRYIL